MRAGLSWFRILGDLVRVLILACTPEPRLRPRICSCASRRPFIKNARSNPDAPRSDGVAAEPLVQLARRIDHRPAQDLRHLAPQGLPPLLALKVRSWPAVDSG